MTNATVKATALSANLPPSCLSLRSQFLGNRLLSSLFLSSLFLASLLAMHAAEAQSRAPQRAHMSVVEYTIESTSAYLNLPDSLPGPIALAPCDSGCAPITLQLVATSTFFLNARQLSFAELREWSSRPSLNVAVHYEPQSKDITRIVLTDLMY